MLKEGMTRFLLVACGGAVGAMARYGLGLAFSRLLPGASWPWPTLSANVIGGLAMGLMAGLLSARPADSQDFIRLFAVVGLLGGFTTFSTFSLETVVMLERREIVPALGYVLASVVLAIAAVFVGLMIARKLFTGVGA